ncbi:hypothetical protein [Streptomyces sp. SID11385]|uniref:hypothetical protein n=1 Tax=Streptomyces sp. SID11385 TaxID=2706031 RepID=UPI0013CC5160|nr:hypothetical protein [Streptomyces sp. SID11385]NEA42714.1 hypothetical protein [Streptomyces sp. SID11385]
MITAEATVVLDGIRYTSRALLDDTLANHPEARAHLRHDAERQLIALITRELPVTVTLTDGSTEEPPRPPHHGHTHSLPDPTSGLTACCAQDPLNLPLGDRITTEIPSTCPASTLQHAADRLMQPGPIPVGTRCELYDTFTEAARLARATKTTDHRLLQLARTLIPAKEN